MAADKTIKNQIEVHQFGAGKIGGKTYILVDKKLEGSDIADVVNKRAKQQYGEGKFEIVYSNENIHGFQLEYYRRKLAEENITQVRDSGAGDTAKIHYEKDGKLMMYEGKPVTSSTQLFRYFEIEYKTDELSIVEFKGNVTHKGNSFTTGQAYDITDQVVNGSVTIVGKRVHQGNVTLDGHTIVEGDLNRVGETTVAGQSNGKGSMTVRGKNTNTPEEKPELKSSQEEQRAAQVEMDRIIAERNSPRWLASAARTEARQLELQATVEDKLKEIGSSGVSKKDFQYRDYIEIEKKKDGTYSRTDKLIALMDYSKPGVKSLQHIQFEQDLLEKQMERKNAGKPLMNKMEVLQYMTEWNKKKVTEKGQEKVPEGAGNLGELFRDIKADNKALEVMEKRQDGIEKSAPVQKEAIAPKNPNDKSTQQTALLGINSDSLSQLAGKTLDAATDAAKDWLKAAPKLIEQVAQVLNANAGNSRVANVTNKDTISNKSQTTPS